MAELDAYLEGRARPETVPEDWLGEPLPQAQGWRWCSPVDRSDAVRLYRGEEAPYIVVTMHGNVIGRDGTPTGEQLYD